jgi:hypothetical protein
MGKTELPKAAIAWGMGTSASAIYKRGGRERLADRNNLGSTGRKSFLPGLRAIGYLASSILICFIIQQRRRFGFLLRVSDKPWLHNS